MAPRDHAYCDQCGLLGPTRSGRGRFSGLKRKYIVLIQSFFSRDRRRDLIQTKTGTCTHKHDHGQKQDEDDRQQKETSSYLVGSANFVELANGQTVPAADAAGAEREWQRSFHDAVSYELELFLRELERGKLEKEKARKEQQKKREERERLQELSPPEAYFEKLRSGSKSALPSPLKRSFTPDDVSAFSSSASPSASRPGTRDWLHLDEWTAIDQYASELRALRARPALAAIEQQSSKKKKTPLERNGVAQYRELFRRRFGWAPAMDLWEYYLRGFDSVCDELDNAREGAKPIKRHTACFPKD